MIFQSVIAGRFMFCEEHGTELCHYCYCDYRMSNNALLEEFVENNYDNEDDRIEIIELLDEDERSSLNLFSKGFVTEQKSPRTTLHIVRCHLHQTDDCALCFDWFKVLLVSIGFWDKRNAPPPSTSPRTRQTNTAPSRAAAPVSQDVSGLLPPRRRMSRGAIQWSPPLRRATNITFSHPDSPRRFLVLDSISKPLDLFHERRDRGGFQRYTHKKDEGTVLFFTDGACLDNGDPQRRRGGYSLVFCESHRGFGHSLEGTVGGPEQTSNRAELRAVIYLLQLRVWEGAGADRLVVATDSEYIVEGVCERVDKWRARGWKTAEGRPVANRDLWEVLMGEIEASEKAQISVLFWRIPRTLNARADALAKEGADKTDRPLLPQSIAGVMF